MATYRYPIVDRWEGNEVLFSYPEVGSWEGDGLDQDMGSVAAGEILSEYAKACANKVRYGYMGGRTYDNCPDD